MYLKESPVLDATPTASTSPIGGSREISVDRQDDVSTLGDSVLVGMAILGEGEDERTVSVDANYDYAMGRYMDPADDGPSRVDSSIFSSYTSLGPMGTSVIEDDASFEDLFMDGNVASHGERFDVDVPTGKLGMVVDTPHGGVPVVHAVKDDSILVGRVQVGDRLVAVDHEDVTRMSAVEVSTLIHRKSGKARVLSFVRKTS
jgi:hypothetical protein